MAFALLLLLAKRFKVIDTSKHEALFTRAVSALVVLLAAAGLAVSEATLDAVFERLLLSCLWGQQHTQAAREAGSITSAWSPVTLRPTLAISFMPMRPVH